MRDFDLVAVYVLRQYTDYSNPQDKKHFGERPKLISISKSEVLKQVLLQIDETNSDN